MNLGRCARRKFLPQMIALCFFYGGLPVAFALPTGAIGDATRSAGVALNIIGDKTLTVTAQRRHNFIKWRDFSVSQGESVIFDDKNYLNYVSGTNTSYINGIVKGAGDVWLVNPNGVIFGKNAAVDVGSLHVSGRKLAADDFAAFEENGALNCFGTLGDGNLTGDVVNMGTLNANRIYIEGKDIVIVAADKVTSGADKTDLYADGTINLGYAVSEEPLAVVDESYYQNAAPPEFPNIAFYTANAKRNVNYFAYVRNYAELQSINGNLSGNYMLTQDITADGDAPYFRPLGSFAVQSNSGDETFQSFTGKFFGMGHTITGLKIVSDNLAYVGMFARLGATSVVRDFTLTGGEVNAELANGTLNVGAVAGVMEANGVNQATIIGVANGNSVTAKGAGNDSVNVGGLVGVARGTISESRNFGNVAGQGKAYVGGIIGTVNDTPNAAGFVLENAYNEGNVSREATKTGSVGGLIGYFYARGAKATVRSGVNFGNVFADGNKGSVGGIVGAVKSDTVNNSVTLNLENTINFAPVAGGANRGRVVVDDKNSVINGADTAYYATTDENGNNLYAAGTLNDTGTGKTYGELLPLPSNLFDTAKTWYIDANNLPRLTRIAKMREMSLPLVAADESGDVADIAPPAANVDESDTLLLASGGNRHNTVAVAASAPPSAEQSSPETNFAVADGAAKALADGAADENAAHLATNAVAAQNIAAAEENALQDSGNFAAAEGNIIVAGERNGDVLIYAEQRQNVAPTDDTATHGAKTATETNEATETNKATEANEPNDNAADDDGDEPLAEGGEG